MNGVKLTDRPELLAPAGNIENFFAAVDHGADAVYVGCRHYNARASAPNFTLEEIGRLNQYARQQGVRLYVALNVLAREQELPELFSILATLDQITPDGLIIQDAGIAHLCRTHFPDLALHGSTLMTIQNSAGVQFAQKMGFQRAVLARELTLDEVSRIASATTLELEVFVHGALCFSYSGLCLASSFYGGRSSLRGRCTQPCRRLYRSGRNQGYFFSTNDLSAIDLIPKLRQLPISAFKIEGRMKSASYVEAVVRAYRLVLDALPEVEEDALTEARRLLLQAPGRKPTSGFFLSEQHKEVVTPHRSGTSGRLAAKVEWVKSNRMAMRLRTPLTEGDRLRLDSDEAIEKAAFTLKDMRVKGKRFSEALTGTVVTVPRVSGARSGDRVFKTGSKGSTKRSTGKLRRLLRDKTTTVRFQDHSMAQIKKILARPQAKTDNKRVNTYWLRLSQDRLLGASFRAGVDWVVLEGSQTNLRKFQRRKLPATKRDRLIWGLPPIILEKDLPFYEDQVRRLQERGYNCWLVANWAHFQLFARTPELLVADYTFNVLNSQACSQLSELGCRFVILSLENDRPNLQKLLATTQDLIPLVTIYGRPALFTSRLEIRPRRKAPIRGAQRDTMQQERSSGLTQVRSDLPLCLFEHLSDLRTLGANGFVLDLRAQKLHSDELSSLLNAMRRQQCPTAHSTLNYLGKLV
jgi:putative protease